MKKLLLVLTRLLCTSALAQPYPNRPIKFIVPFPPGGNLDFIARSLRSHAMTAKCLLGALAIAFVSTALGGYDEGMGALVRKDYEAAVQEWRPLAQQGEARAQYQMGLLYSQGRGVSRDYAQAAELFRKAAEQGHRSAQHNLAVMYGRGWGVERDESKAIEWYRRAASQGDPQAMFMVGTYHAEGRGTKSDPVEAARWYQKSAQSGFARAQNMLGLAYWEGSGVDRDESKAAAWIRRAADQGWVPGQANLARMYEKSVGVERDYREAYFWYSIALRGLKEPSERAAAEQALSSTQTHLGSDERAVLAARIERWKPKWEMTYSRGD